MQKFGSTKYNPNPLAYFAFGTSLTDMVELSSLLQISTFALNILIKIFIISWVKLIILRLIVESISPEYHGHFAICDRMMDIPTLN